jgi:glycosyltransferase involved in cell wall biosynthesis
MSVPRVSVVVTCFNLGRFLPEAMDSVLSQTFQDFEIVIVDDGSTDRETLRVLTEWQRPGIRLLRTENHGLSAARNYGAAHTSGEFLCMLDADDRLDSTMLEKSVAVLDGDSSVGFASHWLRTFGDEEWEWTPASCDLGALLDKNTVNGAALMRRTVFAAVGGFDESMRRGCEDWDFWLSAVERGIRGRIIPEVLFYYRRRPDSMSRVMMDGSVYAEVYRDLTRKHAGSFCSHVEDLVLAREEELDNLRTHVRDLDAEYDEWLGPEFERRSDEIGRLERRRADQRNREDLERERAQREEALAAQQRVLDRQQQVLVAQQQTIERSSEELVRTQADFDQAREEWRRERAAASDAHARALGDMETQIRTVETDAQAVGAEAVRARSEVLALRESWSWRLTAPLRWLHDLGRGRRRS